MKKTDIKILHTIKSLIVILLSVFIITSCGGGGDDEPSAQELAEELLEASWDISNGGSITLDGSAVSDRYQGFSLVIGDKTFTTTNAGDLFPASGTWEWVGDSDNRVITGNGKEITINELNNNTFAFSFLKTDQNVAAGIPGNYSVTVTR